MLFYDLFRKDPNLVTVAAGETLCAEGEPGADMYVLLSGTAEIRSGACVLEELGVGGIVGEMGVIEPGPPSATVRALTDCTFAVIDRDRFDFLVRDTPQFAVDVMKVMAQRMRQCDAMLKSQGVC
ncbi:MAG: cyclic nucleotide-binding domain-containing protein [Zoogloeaceae bacterium]|nr:cyclic nucleotide-binding domain-containing protein [Zoogloeaceae bacterium]